MPDAQGLPTDNDILRKLGTVIDDDFGADFLSEIRPVVQAVVADLQSPAGSNDMGGTGRRFVPVTETRNYDGSGQAILRVDDIVPNSTFTVTVFGFVLTDVVLSDNNYGQGHNTLVRPSYPLQVFSSYLGNRRIFPAGIQNVAVAATWGFDAALPADVYEAIRCEVCYRLIVQGYIGINGVGETVKLSEFEVNTAAGVTVWRDSSPVGVFHQNWLNTLSKYRDDRYQGGRMMRKMY